jgi:chorismate mutase
MTVTASRVASIALGVALAMTCTPIPSRADVPSPLYALVDAAAQRLQTGDAVAASKWTTGGPIEDHVGRVFRDQIDATVAVEYGRFSEWKLNPASAPVTAPNLSDSRTAIDVFNRTMVAEIAAQWDSLHSPGCLGDLEAARNAVVVDRGFDDLYQRGLAFATGSYCR